ncbi:MAG: RNA-guided endonuclease TnpB family protein [Phormidium sp.]
MYLTQKNQIRELNKSGFVALRELCRLSKNLYNVGLYTVRQYFFQEHKHLRYESAYHLCKTNENYKFLNTDIAQQTLKVVDRTFKSFYGLISAVKNGSYQQKVKLPNYLPKDGYFLLIIPCGWTTRKAQPKTPRLAIKNGKFRVPMSNDFKKQHGEIWVNFPKRINYESLKEIRIHPKYNARYFEVEFISEVEPEPVEVKNDSAISIDLGVDNLAACVDTSGSKLKAMCERYGLIYTEQEESYTSKASAVDGDDIPVYNADNPSTYQFSGKRIKRGLYRTKDGHLVNSDLNGSLNIGRKSKHNGFTGVSRAALTQPRRINLLKLEKWRMVALGPFGTTS